MDKGKVEDGMTEKKKGASLVQTVTDALRDRIAEGEHPVGSRLPSNAELCAEFGFSRTVIREAIASLASDGMVESRQGSGVFVTSSARGGDVPFADMDPARISSVIEILELRTAIEVEAAGLAARRRSPQQMETIIERFQDILRREQEGDSTAGADFEFHFAISAATNNPRFCDVLSLLRQVAIPRHVLNTAALPEDYATTLNDEHRRIMVAILDQDEAAAKAEMRAHLSGSLRRYRALAGVNGTRDEVRAAQ